MTTPSFPASGHGEVAGLVEERDLLEANAPLSARETVRYLEIERRLEQLASHEPAGGDTQAGLRPSGDTQPSPVEARADGVREEGKAESVGWLDRDDLAVLSRIKGAPGACRVTAIKACPTPGYVPIYASQPDPAAEIAKATKERDDWKERYEDQWAKNTTEDMAGGALSAIQALLDDGGIPRGTFADDQVRNLVALYNAAVARAEWAESELAVIREALEEAIEFADQDLHVLTPAGEAMIERWRAALANTADRGQERKGNG